MSRINQMTLFDKPIVEVKRRELTPDEAAVTREILDRIEFARKDWIHLIRSNMEMLWKRRYDEFGASAYVTADDARAGQGGSLKNAACRCVWLSKIGGGMMPAKTKIEWCDYSSNPIKYALPGQDRPINLCVPASAGCTNCYASAITKRFTGVTYKHQVMQSATAVLVEKEIQHMIRFKPNGPFKNGSDRPKVFVGDMTDIFGDWVPFDLLDQLFAAFALRPDVDWLLLTKRPKRMAEYVNSGDLGHRIYQQVTQWLDDGEQGILGNQWDRCHDLTSDSTTGLRSFTAWGLPLPNVWLGTSIENQQTADKRIPHLLRCPAAVRFVSAEPLLGEIDLNMACGWKIAIGCCSDNHPSFGSLGIHWLITGGESGHGARPCNIEHIRSLVEQCHTFDVPVFVKQLGSNAWDDSLIKWGAQCAENSLHLKSRKGSDISEWPAELQVRQIPVGGGDK